MIDNFSWSQRRQLSIDANNADQAEVAAIIQNIAATSVSVLDERIAMPFDDEEDDGVEDPLAQQLERDEQIEGLMAGALEEIERREHWLEGCYPFELINGSLRYKGSKTGVYEYCLAISQAPNITARPYVDLIRYFEILAADIIRMFIGPGAGFLRTGAPSFPNINSAPNFQSAIERLHDLTEEWIWDPQEDAIGDLGAVKDEGLDFVVWKKIDSRKGSLFIIGQCACGNTDWHQKDQDIDGLLKKIGRWLRKISYVPPVRAFALPHPITANNIFSTLTDNAGLTLDRLRLTKIAEHTDHAEYFVAEHHSHITDLTKLVIPSQISR